MRRKSLVALFIVALVATNVFLSIQLYCANRQIAMLTVERDQYLVAAKSLQAVLIRADPDLSIISGEPE